MGITKSPQNERTRFPEERDKLWVLFFYITGISTLFVWNSVLSLTNYWKTKIHDGIQNQYSFFYMFGAFLNVFFFDAINQRVSFRTQIIGLPIVMTCVFYLMLVLGEFFDERFETQKIGIFQFFSISLGFMMNTMQSTMTRFVFSFGVENITKYTTGTAIAGVACALQAFVLSYLNVSITWQYQTYLFLITLNCAFIVVVFYKFLNRYGDLYFKTINVSKTESDSKKIDWDYELGYSNKEIRYKANVQDMVKKTLDGNSMKESWTQRLSAGKNIYTIALIIIQCYTCTLGIFPAQTFVTGCGLVPEHAFPCVILIFNIGDLIGKYGYNIVQVSDGWGLYLYGVLRSSIFPILFALCVIFRDHSFWGSSYLSIQLILALSASNGHLTTACFANAPNRLADDEKKYSGFILVMCLLFGLVIGSLIDLVSLTTY